MSQDNRTGEQNIITKRELAVLKFLNSKQNRCDGSDTGDIGNNGGTENRNASEIRLTTELSEISSETGVGDNDDVLRLLYTLEGKSLVKPEPEGDFTSTRWEITEVGQKAAAML